MNNTDTSNLTMRAWSINAYGEPIQMKELSRPQPGPNDVLIRMHGAEVGDWDELVRTGEWKMDRPFPLVLGLSGSGTVAKVGKDVRGFKEGRPVYAYSYPLYDNGAWADYMLVPERYAATPPPALELTRAGVVPVAGLTAHETLIDILNVRKNDVVLITAASGGVGHLAVQLAKHLGAKVIATTGRDHVEFVQALGADLVIDYTSVDVMKAIEQAFPQGASKALNGVSGEAANLYVNALAGGGKMVDLPGMVTATRPDVEVISDYVVRGDGARLKLVSDLIDEQILKVEVNDVFPFEQAPEALRKVLGKHVLGKIGIKIR